MKGGKLTTLQKWRIFNYLSLIEHNYIIYFSKNVKHMMKQPPAIMMPHPKQCSKLLTLVQIPLKKAGICKKKQDFCTE